MSTLLKTDITPWKGSSLRCPFAACPRKGRVLFYFVLVLTGCWTNSRVHGGLLSCDASVMRPVNFWPDLINQSILSSAGHSYLACSTQRNLYHQKQRIRLYQARSCRMWLLLVPEEILHTGELWYYCKNSCAHRSSFYFSKTCTLRFSATILCFGSGDSCAMASNVLHAGQIYEDEDP